MKRFPQFTWNVTTVLFLVAVSICLAIVSGCGSNTVAPTTEETKAFDWLAEQGNGVDADRGPVAFALENVVDKLIGPKGGVISVPLPGSKPATFIIPKGALTVETPISITATVTETPYGKLIIYDCGPDGTVFNVPLLVTMPITGKSAASMYYFNEDKQQWELQETSVVKGGDAVFHIYHFSKYGIQ